MGTSADSNGITLQFVNDKNEPTEPPIFGAFAQLRGVDRSEALKTPPWPRAKSSAVSTG